jgi:hypothetical protein
MANPHPIYQSPAKSRLMTEKTTNQNITTDEKV